ncbi:MAG: acetyl-CoA carboxylase carboxyl transferase subunit beta, partial [Acidobacteriota bacterium]
MTWFKREKRPLQSAAEEERTVRTEGLFTKCEGCKAIIWKKDLEANLFVCPKCSYHFRIDARKRLE